MATPVRHSIPLSRADKVVFACCWFATIGCWFNLQWLAVLSVVFMAGVLIVAVLRE